MSVDIIYCVTNIVNGKKYIRQTVRTLEDRKREHLISNLDLPFFKWEILCKCDNKEELDDMEFHQQKINNQEIISWEEE